MSSMLHACRQHLTTEEQQPHPVWAAPYQFQEFVVVALWRKLLVAQRLYMFGVLTAEKCPLCGVVEDHAHVQKRRLCLQDSLAFVRRLWGAHVEDSEWYEPLRMCIDYPMLSVTTVQGKMVW